MIYTITLNPSIDYIMQLDELALGKTNRSVKEYKFPGGKGINVSRILHQLGIDATALGFLGGFTGQFIEDALIKEGLVSDFTKIAADTRINVKLKAETESEINASGPIISDEEIQIFQDKLAQITEKDFVILSGSAPRSLPADFYQLVIHSLQQRQIPFALDTTGSQLLDNLSSHPFLIKPNKDELEELTSTKLNTRDEIIAAARQLLIMGAQNVLVSLGADGAILVNEAEIIHSPAPRGTLKNSVGAGDSMVAGFIGSYTQYHDLKLALKLGIACGSATAFSDDLASKTVILSLLEQIQ